VWWGLTGGGVHGAFACSAVAVGCAHGGLWGPWWIDRHVGGGGVGGRPRYAVIWCLMCGSPLPGVPCSVSWGFDRCLLSAHYGGGGAIYGRLLTLAFHGKWGGGAGREAVRWWWRTWGWGGARAAGGVGWR